MKPSIIDRARLALRVYRQGLPMRTKTNPITFPTWQQGQPQWHLVDLDAYIREGFNMNTLIYSAIMYKAKAMSSVPLRAYSGDIDNPELLPEDHPLTKLCARPNPSQSWREYQMLQEVHLNLTGNAFGFLDRPAAGAFPAQLLPLNPLRVYIVPGDKGLIKGYWYVPEGKTMTEGIPMLPEDVSHVKFPNPGDSMDGAGYGLSPLSPLARSADVDNSITDFLKKFFDSGTMISGLLKFSMPMTNEQVDRVRARWKEIYGGHDNWDEIGVLDQSGEYQRLGYTFDEMGFETLDERNETRILGPFGVPPILIGSRVGLARSTYSNYDQAYSMFWQDTMLHECKLFEDDYQYYLSEGDAFPAFDFSDVPAFQQDVPNMVQAWRGLVEYGIPKTKAANIVGLQLGDLIDGDVAYMPLSLVPIGEASATREAQTEAQTPPTTEEPAGTPPEEGAPDNATEDERAIAKYLESINISMADFAEFLGDNSRIANVKKNYLGPTTRKPRFGKHTTQLVGAGNASSRLAQNKRLKPTNGKYSA